MLVGTNDLEELNASLYNRLHGVMNRKIAISILTAMKT
jgi:hypothetical protein